MNLLFISGTRVRIHFSNIFESVFAPKLLWQIPIVIALSLILYGLAGGTLLPIGYAVLFFLLEIMLVWIFYLSILMVACLLAFKLGWKNVYEIIIMFLAFLIEVLISLWLITFVPPDLMMSPTEIWIAHGFLFVSVQLITTFILVPRIHFPENAYEAGNVTDFLTSQVDTVIDIGTELIPIDDIKWIRAEGRKTRIALHNNEIVVSQRFRDLIERLDDQNGMQIHRSIWIAGAAFKRLNRSGRSVTLITDDEIAHAIARDRVNEVETWLSQNANEEEAPKLWGDVDLYVRFLLRPKMTVRTSEWMRMFVSPKAILLSALGAFLLFVINPVNWFLGLPTIYLVGFWAIFSLISYPVYLGCLITVAVISHKLGRRSIFEPIVMLMVISIVWMTSHQPIIWLSNAAGIEFSYPYGAALSLVCLYELALAYVAPMLLSMSLELEQDGSTVANDLDRNLLIKFGRRTARLGEISYVQSEGHYLNIQRFPEPWFIKGTLSDISAQVKEGTAIQPHRSYWVPRHAIRGYTWQNSKLTLILKSDDLIPVARGKIAETRKWLSVHLIPQLETQLTNTEAR